MSLVNRLRVQPQRVLCFEAADRIEALESALKLANEALVNLELALDEMREYPITYDLVVEALIRINEVLGE